jgi:hypothetical protein
VNPAQRVDHALGRNASKRPTAKSDVEPLPLDVERLRTVNRETHPLSLFTRQPPPSRLDLLFIRVERIDALGIRSHKSRQPTVTTADLQSRRALQPNERLYPSRLNPIPIYNMHGPLLIFAV